MIVGLFLRNFKIYKNMNFIPFVTSEKDRMSIFAGDNGAGKSTILESIQCLMNNIDSKEWAYTVGQKKDSAHIFPLFLIKKSNWDDDDPQMARISHYFWEHHFNEMPANEVTKSFIKYRNKLKEWYHPSDYYLIAIGKDYEGNILLTTTFNNKISSEKKKDGVSKDKIMPALDEGKTVLLDRYTTSSVIYQAASLPEYAKKDFIEYVMDFEYNRLGIKKPDIVIFLTAPYEVIEQIRNARKVNDGIQKDIHESNKEYLKTVYNTAQYACELLDWKKVECSNENQMRPIEEIHEDIIKLIKM